VYLKESTDANTGQVVLRAVSVKLGIADASSVEVVEGLKETDEVISGTVAAPVTTPRNPLNPFGGGAPRR
jgi:hypothetical protein